MRTKNEMTNLFKSFIATALLLTACGKPYQVYDASAIAIQRESLLNFKTEELEDESATTATDDSNATISTSESSEDSIITDFKSQLESLIEKLQKLDVSLLPEDAGKRRDENIEILKELLVKVSSEGSEGQEFRTNLVTLRRAASAHQAKGISDEEKQFFAEQACKTMGAHLEKNDFPDERLKVAVQSDYDKKCK